MIQIISKTKILLVGCFILFAVCSHGQIVLNVSGQVLFEDNSPAIEAGLLLTFTDDDLGDFTSTDKDGNYSFSLDIPSSSVDTCFTLILIDCSGEFILHQECFTESNTNFEKDFLFCENGSSYCNSFISPSSDDTSGIINLSVINIGVGPYVYLWEDGTVEPTNSIPLDYIGEFCVTITDAQDCISDACINLDPIDPCFVFISEENGYNSVALMASGFGQSEQIDYIWSTGEQESKIQVTEGGKYCVTITDNFGCLAVDCLNVVIDSTAWDDCFAFIYKHNWADTGIDELFVDAFGESPFTYSWTYNGQFFGQLESIQPTEEGLYCAAVTDATDCVFSACYDYTFTPKCSAFIGYKHSIGAGELVAIAYGVAPFTYSWSSGENGNTINITESGEYCVSIIDAVGCISDYCLIVDLETSNLCAGEILTEFVDSNSANLSVFIPGTDTPEIVSYLWNTGQNQSVIYVQQEGLYCVEVTLEDGCIFETCTYFSADGEGIDKGVVISYYDQNAQLGQSAEIELYKVDGQSAHLYESVQEWPLSNIQGLFYSNNLVDGTYFVRAKPQDKDKFIPSYSTKSSFWDESDHFIIENGGKGLKNVVNVFAIPISNISGLGKIGGFSWSYESSDNIMLFHESVVVGQKYTDDNGQFLFSSLPYGTYTVVRERPGMERAEVIVTISASSPIVNDVQFNDITASLDNEISVEITVFPNPVNSIVNIFSDSISEILGTVSIFNVDGKLLANYEDLVPNNKTISLDISNMAKGVYFLKIEKNGIITMKKIIKI
ncbi:MAG: hypothetical protein ACJA1A_001635 [Saprospiraceae bacterium]|jgi:hypothetical protein